ncbi:uncharacterized protein N7483_000367 [Penicillium malachiteum]|uniref:uncharacterized protein n=1 Tax=Penicillium malachiteum TaxID=1324776 RepID=UPI002546EF97|nr:uncharacterized protein N7483_000367 [Penicillium malachiteum]KAJ5735242.1 hypothetical protein N7483_000367 [Penicillium malachiteum]
MSPANNSLLSLDPTHTSCVAGKTALTCRSCAGNAPRGSVCTSCAGLGYTLFLCGHCHPAGGGTPIRTTTWSTGSIRTNTIAVSSRTANTTPGSSAPSSPGSLSRSPSTSFPDPRVSQAWKRVGGGSRDGTGCGRVETNTPRNL